MAFPATRQCWKRRLRPRRAAQVMAGVVFMLIVAALLEGFARQLVDITSTRLALGGFMLVFWCGYFFVWRRGRVTAEGQ
jgi:ABC-type nickel/cobalt efflux system permease component RcnA